MKIKAVVETAHSLYMKVAAHATASSAIDHASRWGRFHRARHLRRRRELQALQGATGPYFVPTMLVGAKVYQHAKAHPEDLNPPRSRRP
jgi:imidazolonepropionase-like amidohydrolase